MNKYAVLGMLIDVYDGKRLVVVERDYQAVQAAVRVFAEVVQAMDLAGVLTVRRANGAESVQHPSGGRVVFATPRSNRMRGLSADVVFIDNEADRVLVSEPMGAADLAWLDGFRDDVALVLSGRRGEVVRS